VQSPPFALYLTMTIPVVFIFKGKSLPKYVYHSIRMNMDYNPDINFYFLSNHKLNIRFPKFKIILLDHFYQSSDIVFFSDHKTNQFRKGFWNNTIERYLILEKFMNHFLFDKVIHMELDNVGFNLNSITQQLDVLENGMYFPSYKGDVSAASFLFVSGVSSLQGFKKFILENKDKNDMVLLNEYNQKYQKNLFQLPTTPCDLQSEDFGLYDLSILGHYLFGVHKKNLYWINFNLIVYYPQLIHYFIDNQSRFLLEEKSFFLINGYKKYKINNLHVHSKIFNKIRKRNYFLKIINGANKKKKIIIEYNFDYILVNNLLRIGVKIKHFIKKINQ